ncbi:hypothetical protein HYS54_00335 [Candidatus Micrarchaeota archaeon]|nr:hypothetical protein [Candidatus Micrarchaeota archaeon]
MPVQKVRRRRSEPYVAPWMLQKSSAELKEDARKHGIPADVIERLPPATLSLAIGVAKSMGPYPPTMPRISRSRHGEVIERLKVMDRFERAFLGVETKMRVLRERRQALASAGKIEEARRVDREIGEAQEEFDRLLVDVERTEKSLLIRAGAKKRVTRS